MPEISIDHELCLGSGMCIVYAPNTFAHDEQAKAIVANPDGDAIDAIRTAASGCPTSAIHVGD